MDEYIYVFDVDSFGSCIHVLVLPAVCSSKLTLIGNYDINSGKIAQECTLYMQLNLIRRTNN